MAVESLFAQYPIRRLLRKFRSGLEPPLLTNYITEVLQCVRYPIEVQYMLHHLPMIFFLFATLSPSVGHTQACGAAGRALLQCTTDGGTHEVAVCLKYDRISVLRGLFEGPLEVELDESLNNVRYTIDQTDGKSVHALTVYATGGIFQLSTAQPTRMSFLSNTVAAVETICDAASVSPEDPVDGVGQLLPILTDGRSRLALCMESAEHRIDPAACLGYFETACRMKQRTSGEQCGETELDVWNLMVAEAVVAAIAYYEGSVSHPLMAAQLTAAQEHWESSRAADCKFLGGVSFDIESGVTDCLTFLAAHRLRLLESLTGNATLH